MHSHQYYLPDINNDQDLIIYNRNQIVIHKTPTLIHAECIHGAVDIVWGKVKCI